MKKFLSKWSTYAKKQGFDEFEIFEMRGKCIQFFSELSKCYANKLNEKKEILIFLKKEESFLSLKIDKNKNLCFIDRNEHIKKLINEFENTHYEKLTKSA